MNKYIISIHSKPLNERLVGISYLTSKLEYLGWKVIYCEKHPKLNKYININNL